MDYACDLYVTSTQYRELQFFNQKIKEMLETPEGKEWATNIPKEELESPLASVGGYYSFKEDYVEQEIAQVDRKNYILNYCN